MYLTKLPEATAAGIHTAHPAISFFFFSFKKKPKPSEHCPFSTRWNLPAIPEALPVPAHPCMRSILPCRWPEVPAGCTDGRFWEQFAEPSGTSWGREKNREKGLLKGHQAAFLVIKGVELPLELSFLQGTGPCHKCPLPAGVSTDSELCPSWGGMGHWAREGRSAAEGNIL